MQWNVATAWALVGVFLLVALFPRASAAAEPADYPIVNGHFFTQTVGPGGDYGYPVTDDDRIPFWTVYQRLGGPAEIGYPISQRFLWNGYVSQAFQKAILQWNQQTQSVVFVNVFDELSRAGRDGWLRDQFGIPLPVDFADLGRPWEALVAGRLAPLDGAPRLHERYRRSVDPVVQFGLPTSQIAERGDARVIRFQRAVFEEWLIDRPGGRAGEVTLANGGELVRDAGLLPATAMAPRLWPRLRAATPLPAVTALVPNAFTIAPRPVDLPPLRRPAARTDGRPWRVALDPGHGGREIGSTRPMGNGLMLAEKNVNLAIAMRTAEVLREAGVEVTLTRDTDRAVNAGGYDLNRDGRADTSDDLQARAEIPNLVNADLFISIHNNGHANPAQYGTEVYHNAARPFSESNRALAWYLQQRIVQLVRLAGYPTRDRGIKTDLSAGHGGYFAVLGPESATIPSPSRMPAALTESLFVSSYYDSPWLARREIIEAIARGHAEGILDYFEWAIRRG